MGLKAGKIAVITGTSRGACDLTFGMAHDIYEHRRFPIAMIRLGMGWMCTEAVMENFCQGLRPPKKLAQQTLLRSLDEPSLPWERPKLPSENRENTPVA